MNEQAVEHAYNLFQADGYEDSIDDFQSLLQTNGDAVSHAYNLFKNDGYQDTMEDFETLLGLKKKRPNRTRFGWGKWYIRCGNWWFGLFRG